MVITQAIKLDFARRDPAQYVVAKQYDVNSREVLIGLYDNGVAWDIPSGTTAVIRFCKADGKGGVYDRLGESTPAYQITAGSNSVTIALAPEVLTCAGKVLLDVVLINGRTNLATFDIVVMVERSPQDGITPSNDYYNYSTLAELNDVVAQLRLGLSGVVRSVNGTYPDEDGNVNVGAGGAADYLPLTGGTLTGPLQMDGHPIFFDAGNNMYISGATGNLVLGAGGNSIVEVAPNKVNVHKDVHISGEAVIEQTGDAGYRVASEGKASTDDDPAAYPVMALYGTHGDEPVRVHNVATPTDDSDAATKEYVDGRVAGIDHPVTSVNGQTGDVVFPSPSIGLCTTDQRTRVKSVILARADAFRAAGLQPGIPLRVKFEAANAAEGPQLSLDDGDPISIYDARTNAPVEASAIGARIHTFVLWIGYWWLLDPVVESGTGVDGVSPTVAVTDIDGGHRVTITDATGPKTFDVLDGDAGPAGKDGSSAVPDGYCATSASTADKVEEGFVTGTIANGSLVGIWFVNANMAANPTLEVNGVTGAILGSNMEAISPTALTKGMHLFARLERYNGWWMIT